MNESRYKIWQIHSEYQKLMNIKKVNWQPFFFYCFQSMKVGEIWAAHIVEFYTCSENE